MNVGISYTNKVFKSIGTLYPSRYLVNTLSMAGYQKKITEFVGSLFSFIKGNKFT